MAMIGRNAAVAEMGEHRHELHGAVAFAAWLGVHAWLMSGVAAARRRVHQLGVGLLRQDASTAGARHAPTPRRIEWEDDDG